MNSNWMHDHGVTNLTIKEITLPGAHDCFSVGVQENSPFAAPYTLIPRAFGSIIRKWSKTQELTITEQLNEGIRYFDMRIQKYKGIIYTVHGVFCKPLESLLIEIIVFLSDHPSEVVIIDINHVYEMEVEDHLKLLNQMSELFGELLVPSEKINLNVSLNELIERKQRVFLFYDRPEEVPLPSTIWSQSDIASYWPNKTNCTDVVTNITEEGLQWIDERREKVTVLQFIVTPTFDTIKNGVFHSNVPKSIEDIATSSRENFLSYMKSDVMREYHINILLIDYVQRNDEFIKECISRSIKSSKDKN